MCEIFSVAFSRNGADPHFGRRMAELYRGAGLEDVTVEVRAGVYPAGHSRRTIRADLVRSMRLQIVEMGLADQQELEELDIAARKHFESPDVLVVPGLARLAKPCDARSGQFRERPIAPRPQLRNATSDLARPAPLIHLAAR